MSFEHVLPWLALLVSGFSLLVSGYSIYRDRSKISVFCKVVYDCSRDQSENFDNPPPFMKIYVVNTGKRPIFLSDLCGYISKRAVSSWALKDEPIAFDENGVPSVTLSGFVHEVGVRLNDGEIYEYRVKHNDYLKLYSVDNEGETFKKYYLKDVIGNKYFVKGSKSGIKKLLEYQA
ncbi:hypothetical protein [Vibrio aestuarianus]|uniref:hypothetical protein n=1 Tax=Vibrio aestuarianus TaxID=28171 RepID=UPI001D5AE37E|nr:hypothetical protein [Vibrio aestuarianus]EHK9186365.1 hypothetical protein [Vibrio vulnificus]EJG2012477.1 hypothetical protein [Vibrio parahaemolyticus]EIV8492951.1 hypothetical protein [Vibrio vulnificus]EJE8542177.1 hypothetical protein [Vibrio vulnificus]EJG2026218.1 hypothetical protein [Vibrio parahaemolyticus]